MCEFFVISARAFLVLWAVLTAAVIGYALVDLWVSPSLWAEQHFSMEPDFSQIWEVRHWGGRLVRERAWSLLVPNAIVLGGALALVVSGIGRWIRKRRRPELEERRDSVVPASIPSVPPGV
jgi:hypothetical protein